MKGWITTKLIKPCPRCSNSDLRLILVDPIKEIWICYDCGQSQYIPLDEKTIKTYPEKDILTIH